MTKTEITITLVNVIMTVSILLVTVYLLVASVNAQIETSTSVNAQIESNCKGELK